MRLRAVKPRRSDQTPLPLALTFISRSRLAPTQPKSISASSSPSSGRSAPGSPTKPSDRIGQDQDVLVFDPQHGILSLHRLTPSRHFHDHAPGTPGGPSRGHASTSFPGVSTIHRLATSTSADGGRQPSALTRMMGVPAQLTCHDSLVATWTLRRGVDWKEIKVPFQVAAHKRPVNAPHKSK